MSDDRTIPTYTTRLWSEEVGMADPGANFDAGPVLAYSFGGRTLTSDVNKTLYAMAPQAEPVGAATTGQRQTGSAAATVSSENIATDTLATSAQSQRASAVTTVAGVAPSIVSAISASQRQYPSAITAVDGVQPGGNSPLAIGAQITTLKVENTTASALSMAPFTVGHVFAAGHLPAAGAGIALQLPDGSSIASQLNVKALHGDGSVRHAIISAVLPSLAASSSQTLSIRRWTPAAGTGNVGLPGTLPTATVIINGAVYTASAAGHTPDTWFAGPVASDYVFNVPFTGAAGPHPVLTAQFSVRAFSTGHVRIDAVVENTKAYTSTTDIVYDVTLSAGGTTYYSKTGLIHSPAARWKRSFWTGSAPGVHVRHDTAYLIGSKQVPNYDQSIVIPETVLAGYATELATAKFDPMQFGRLTPYMGTTGGRPEIGLMPDTYVTTILSMDRRAKAIMLATADTSGSWMACRRDDSSGPGAGRPLSALYFPYASLLGNIGDCWNPATGKNEHLPALSTVSQSTADSSHQAAFCYLPYLLTGDFFYLEGLHFWAGFNSYVDNPYYRDFEKARVRSDQVRGQAWSLRTMAECAAITPDDHPSKQMYKDWYDNNIDWYNARYTDGNANTLGIITNGYALGYPVSGQAETGMAPWMDDFFTAAIGHGVELLDHAGAKRLLAWKAKFQLGRLNDPAVCVLNAAIYSLGVRPTSTSPFFGTLAECYAFTVPPAEQQYPCGSTGSLSFHPGCLPGDIDGYPGADSGFPSNYQVGLAAAVDSGVAGGAQAWAKFMARPTKPDYRYGPQWAVVPRTV